MSRKITEETLQIAVDLLSAKEMANNIDDDRTIVWIEAEGDENEDDEPHRNFVRVQAECLTDGFSDSRIKTIQLAVLRALENYIFRGVPLSDRIATELLAEFFNLLQGKRTYLFAPMRKRGRPKEPIAHTVDVSSAVRYIRSARMKFIDDPEPVQTVLEHFGGAEERGLNKETVEGWLVADEFESHIPDGNDDFDSLTSRMKFSGQHYVLHFLKAKREKLS
jgi:hypothetical protein